MLLERDIAGGGEPAEHLAGETCVVDERRARADLRDQIARLEAELAALAAAAWPRVDLTPFAARRAGPRLLGLGELERVRDELAGQAAALRGRISAQAEVHEANRALIEDMLLAPARHKWVRVSNADIGENGCKSWHVRPRLGLIGMLAGWWHVKVSSGCPPPAPG